MTNATGFNIHSGVPTPGSVDELKKCLHTLNKLHGDLLKCKSILSRDVVSGEKVTLDEKTEWIVVVLYDDYLLEIDKLQSPTTIVTGDILKSAATVTYVPRQGFDTSEELVKHIRDLTEVIRKCIEKDGAVPVSKFNELPEEEVKAETRNVTELTLAMEKYISNGLQGPGLKIYFDRNYYAVVNLYFETDSKIVLTLTSRGTIQIVKTCTLSRDWFMYKSLYKKGEDMMLAGKFFKALDGITKIIT